MAAKKKKAGELTLGPREARWLERYLLHGNAGRAAREAGFRCKSDAAYRVRGSELKKRLNLPLKELMEQAGLTSPAILRSISQGLNAKTAHVNYDRYGMQHVYRSPDWQARARFTDMAIRLSGGYPKSQLELPFEVEDGKIVVRAEFEVKSPVGEEQAA